MRPQRGTRPAGERRRHALLIAATRLFRERGLDGVSVGEIAQAAGAYPSQVTYYFGGKEELFVEVACADIERLGIAMRRAAIRSDVPDAMVAELMKLALESTAPLAFIEGQLLAHRRPELAVMVRETMERLYADGERAIVEILGDRGWDLDTTPDVQIRLLWSVILGVTLESAGTGGSFRRDSMENAMLTIFRPGTTRS